MNYKHKIGSSEEFRNFFFKVTGHAPSLWQMAIFYMVEAGVRKRIYIDKGRQNGFSTFCDALCGFYAKYNLEWQYIAANTNCLRYRKLDKDHEHCCTARSLDRMCGCPPRDLLIVDELYNFKKDELLMALELYTKNDTIVIIGESSEIEHRYISTRVYKFWKSYEFFGDDIEVKKFRK